MTSYAHAPAPTPTRDDELLPRVRRERAARAVVAALEQFVAECLAATATECEWVDQSASPLGRRRHLAAVRQGHLVGRKIGKRVLVRRADLNSYLEKQTVLHRPDQGSPADEVDPADAGDVAKAVLSSVGLRQRRKR